MCGHLWRPLLVKSVGLEMVNLDYCRRDDHGEENREEERDHRHGKFRRQGRSLLLRFAHARVAILLCEDAKRRTECRTEFLRLYQAGDYGLHAVEAGAQCEV